MKLRTGLFIAAACAVIPVADAVTFFGPSAYLSAADIPAGLYAGGSPLFLENFEDSSLDGGITASVGSVIPPGFPGFIDSVDADDGSIDGSGLDAHSWFTSGPSVTFSMPVGTTAAGLVWTDGVDPVWFEAFGPANVSLGVIGPFALANGSFAGETAEDRFFGVSNPGGISAIRVFSTTSGGVEVDHVQYGLAAVPEVASTGVLLLVGVSSLFLRRRK